MNIVEVKNLSIEFQTDEHLIQAVKDVSFSVPKGKTVGLVGESGSGKSVTALSLIRLIPKPPGRITSGQVFFRPTVESSSDSLNNEGQDILKWPEKDMQKLRGNRISMIFQEPMSSLNPVWPIGPQIAESLMLHKKQTKKQALEQAIELLEQVEVPVDRAKSYPHQLSGGQRQRVMIAIALACHPDLLIADEPTTALDVTIQQQIMELLKNLQQKYSMGILFITHDLGLISEIADKILVMWKGRVVESGSSLDIFQNPRHPYTKGLLACRPTLDKQGLRLPVMSDYMDHNGEALTPKASLKAEQKSGAKNHNPPLKPSPSKVIKTSNNEDILLQVKGLKKYFPLEKSFFGKALSFVKAVDDVSFTLRQGEILGLVGESGCGKTTLGRVILRLLMVSDGHIVYRGKDITSLSQKALRPLRRKMQVIFQDPYASLNPRMTIGASIMEPMIIHQLGGGRKDRVKRTEELLEKVGLTGDMQFRYPHEFSGGQKQRICIARALAVEPEFIVCDESVSALDVSIQAQIINLLLDLKEEMDLSYIFISHDLAVVKFIADKVLVMNKGKIIEQNSSSEIYKNPKQAYTKKLLSSIPKGDTRFK